MAKRKKWQDLTITDDYMFKLVMMYPHICKHLIESILHIKIRELVYLENEKSYKNHYDSKGIRLDVYVEDADNSRFILEMQVRDYGEEELGKRARFYQSSIDYDFLAAGHKYKELGGAAVMFFCPFKLFDGNRRVYTFRNVCTENKEITLKDGVVKVLLSSAGSPTDDIDPDVAAFLDYMNGKITNNGFITEIDDTIRSVKLDGTKEAGYMTFQMLLEEERDEAVEENRREIIRGMLEHGISIETISSITKVPEKDVIAISDEFSSVHKC
ncbi:Rpn family recombination-promoting nuclease/putative transposase [Pseudobutyrivibrio sp.]|uniref:Rpn family recombination-promoting nuclease/putative transposase n=1 Tax=Pseudobutyrivibrio sp. TaxID=2014367 RepID=UPI001B76D3BA|nr:Rpn family recombination-promoting nuclease/putative transposase [Pseudobutyrivibrio sp.]MBP3263242.1 Rpn family recombination-promoting nuclease/putative transposase [Pseudobutyrivibrio sp.]